MGKPHPKTEVVVPVVWVVLEAEGASHGILTVVEHAPAQHPADSISRLQVLALSICPIKIPGIRLLSNLCPTNCVSTPTCCPPYPHNQRGYPQPDCTCPPAPKPPSLELCPSAGVGSWPDLIVSAGVSPRQGHHLSLAPQPPNGGVHLRAAAAGPSSLTDAPPYGWTRLTGVMPLRRRGLLARLDRLRRRFPSPGPSPFFGAAAA